MSVAFVYSKKNFHWNLVCGKMIGISCPVLDDENFVYNSLFEFAAYFRDKHLIKILLTWEKYSISWSVSLAMLNMKSFDKARIVIMEFIPLATLCLNYFFSRLLQFVAYGFLHAFMQYKFAFSLWTNPGYFYYLRRCLLIMSINNNYYLLINSCLLTMLIIILILATW